MLDAVPPLVLGPIQRGVRTAQEILEGLVLRIAGGRPHGHGDREAGPQPRPEARSPEAREHLKALLDGRERIEGVTLQSRDRFRIIETLIAANSDSTLMNSQGASAPDFTISPRCSTIWVCGEIG